jgi:hypothetical protein
MAPNVSTWPPIAIDRDAAVILICVYCTIIPEKITKFAYAFHFSFNLKMCRLSVLIWSDDLQTEAELIFSYGFYKQLMVKRSGT